MCRRRAPSRQAEAQECMCDYLYTMDQRCTYYMMIWTRSTFMPCVTRRKQNQPGITPNDNTTHVPTTGSSAALTKPDTPAQKAK